MNLEVPRRFIAKIAIMPTKDWPDMDMDQYMPQLHKKSNKNTTLPNFSDDFESLRIFFVLITNTKKCMEIYKIRFFRNYSRTAGSWEAIELLLRGHLITQSCSFLSTYQHLDIFER